MKLSIYRKGKTYELEQFINNSGIKEKFDYNAHFIFVAKQGNKILFVNAYRIEDAFGEIIPRFIHIILADEIKRSRKAIELMLKAEKVLKLLQYKKTFAYINFDRQDMAELAMKFGYKKSKSDNKATYYFKNIGGK